jgi:hypothetical protein
MADLGIKRKRTVNPRLLDDDNMSSDAIKRRKLEALKTTSQIQHEVGTSHASHPATQSIGRWASVETVHDDEDTACHNAGSPKNSSTILESANDNNNIPDTTQLRGTDGLRVDRQEPETEEQAETDDDELSKSKFKNTILTMTYSYYYFQHVCKRIGDRKFTPSFSPTSK